MKNMETKNVYQATYHGLDFFVRFIKLDEDTQKDITASATKLNINIDKNPLYLGWYCGYVKVPKGCPYGKNDNYDAVPIECHGGLTYAREGIIGFDCAHYDDAENPKDLNYVTQECKNIINQLIQLKSKGYPWVSENEY
jgi:hypothetical protein